MFVNTKVKKKMFWSYKEIKGVWGKHPTFISPLSREEINKTTV